MPAQDRKSIGTYTMEALDLAKIQAAEVPKWKLLAFKRGGYLTGVFLALDFIGRWAVAIFAPEVVIPSGLGYYAIVFTPLLVGLAIASPSAFKLFTGFVKSFRSLRNQGDSDGS